MPPKLMIRFAMNIGANVCNGLTLRISISNKLFDLEFTFSHIQGHAKFSHTCNSMKKSLAREALLSPSENETYRAFQPGA
jgi:hypothetical protein